MTPTPISSLDQPEEKIFHELDVHHVQKVGIKRFWAQESEISLKAVSALESARRKYFLNSTNIISREQESNVFLAQEAKMNVTAISSLPIGDKKIFHELNVHHVQKVGIKHFCCSGDRNESNRPQLAPIGEKEIFLEVDAHHVQKIGIKRFQGQKAEMTLTTISSLESARRKFFLNSTYILSRKWKSNVFWLRRPK